jgi:hypothetical protein
LEHGLVFRVIFTSLEKDLVRGLPQSFWYRI